MRGSKVSKIQRRNWKQKYPDWWNDSSSHILKFCQVCGVPSSPENPIQRHHIIPLSKGGSNTSANLKYVCEPCHNKKHGKVGLHKPKRSR